jgi:hypothetical protein
VEDDDERLYDPQTYIEFTRRIEAARAATVGYLTAAKSRGAKIAGFGASISCTTLIYAFGIGEFIQFLVDDNPAKIGRYSPGLHLPVKASSAAGEADIVIALAWRFAADFKRAHPHVKLAVPLPKFHVA